MEIKARQQPTSLKYKQINWKPKANILISKLHNFPDPHSQDTLQPSKTLLRG